MPRKVLVDRNIQIARELASNKPRKQVAESFGISYSQSFRAEAQGRAALETMATAPQLTQTGVQEKVTPYRQLAVTGLKRFGGQVLDDYDRVFTNVLRRVQLYREMGDDPEVQAVLQAIRMLIRRVSWYVEAGGESPADAEAAEFVESCMNDMSQTWADTIEQGLNCIQFGFQPAEIVYKKRQGQQKETLDPEVEDTPSSKFDDGRIGWRKWVFIAPETLAPGDEWIFDEYGGLQGLNQQAPPTYARVAIPIDKAILFRTTVEKGNPEGRALLRAMFKPYWYKKGLQEIEGISAERMGAGLPVVYMGDGMIKNNTPGDDVALMQEIMTNVRADEQMGVVLPWPKLGTGKEGEGVLLELMSPPSRGAVDFNQTIQRYSQSIAMTGLAQFIHLGMNSVGSRSLGESGQNLFMLAISGWVQMFTDTIQRYAIDRLMRLNNFPGLTANPVLTHESIEEADIATIANYINTLVGAELITPSMQLEEYLLNLADLPVPPDLEQRYADKELKKQQALDAQAKAAEAQLAALNNPKAQGKPPFGKGDDGEMDVAQGEDGEDSEGDGEEPVEEAAEKFARPRQSGKIGAKTKEANAVNAYQAKLQAAYAGWADDAAEQLADEEDEDKRRELLAALLLLLSTQLKKLGRENLPNAVELALDGDTPFAEAYGILADEIEENDGYIDDSLIPAIGQKLTVGLSDGDILAALAAGVGAAALTGLLATFGGRVTTYAGAWWDLYNKAVGAGAKESGKGVRWVKDPNANHCPDCEQYGDEDYESYEAMISETGGKSPANGVQCGNNCRCWLETI